MIKISACVIVKNEEKNMPAWLHCVQNIADECIVVDTGSTDATVRLAKEAGARVYELTWQDDFSYAKNYALDKATGDWIIFLDADEFFPDEEFGLVRELISKYHGRKEVAGIFTQRIEVDVDNDYEALGSSRQIRIFRNSPFIRYVGKIHETLQNTGKRKQTMMYDNTLHIYHTGYSQKLIQSKVDRNLEQLLAERKRRGPEPMDAYYLADCYYAKGMYHEALQYADEAIKSPIEAGGLMNRPYAIREQSLIYLEADEQDIVQAMEQGQEAFPTLAEFALLLAAYYWDKQDYLLAERYNRQGLECYQHNKERNTLDYRITDHAETLLPNAWWRAGELYRWRGQEDKAGTAYRKGLALQPQHEKLRRSLEKLSGAKRALPDCKEAEKMIRRVSILYRWAAAERQGIEAIYPGALAQLLPEVQS
ncbi:Glycosyl transferase family 2 [Selenomonas sp. GACV-9]|uniref:glycosyltransferase n=1 Tax=Selenomonas sp. GACV-9 TaxID=3158782 RepID=UPI0008E56C9C|nr:Glycosyl transferase family 2 [Selenomonas ruminantium]